LSQSRSRAPTLAEVFDRLRAPLGLSALHLDRAETRPLPAEPATGGYATLAGHLNLVQPNRIQVLGPTEIDYWQGQSDSERNELLLRLLRSDLFGIVVTDDQEAPAEIVARARYEGVPLLAARADCERVIGRLRHFLGHALAARMVLHGVFLDVLGVGVLLSGGSGIGKSELALELVSRGHSLVADDAPEFTRPEPDTVEGEAPELLQDFLEVAGMGVLNIRAMYGDAAIRHQKPLQLIIQLEALTGALRHHLDRLNGNFSISEILEVPVSTITLPVAPGRNLAVMVEAAVRNYLLTRRGYNAADEFMQRQQRAIKRDDPCA
jgi:HPr kinase/phosphorylase